jgi:rhodanese-related sulfurtransferase
MSGEKLARLEPHEVKEGLDNGSILLIDVREPHEFVEARIPGSLLFPLSTFDPACLPEPGKKRLVFSCRSGNRSVIAFNKAGGEGLACFGHLEGGIKAWAAAGFVVIQTDPATGQPKVIGGRSR